MREVAALNVAEPWGKVSVPVLVVYGDGDFVTTLADHERIVEIVNGARSGHATLAVARGMDHHLDRAGTQQQAYDLRVTNHKSGPYEPMVSQVVGDWLVHATVAGDLGRAQGERQPVPRSPDKG